MNKQLRWIFWTALIMGIGLILLKYIPMYLFGKRILFDASLHFTLATFCLYILFFFIDQNKKWRIPYFIFSIGVLTTISIHRIIANQHNGIGILLGFLISTIAIIIPRWKQIKKKLKF